MRPAWAEFHGYYAACIGAARARNQIKVVREVLRGKGMYDLADALRDTESELDRAVSYPEPSLAAGKYDDIHGKWQEKWCGSGSIVFRQE